MTQHPGPIADFTELQTRGFMVIPSFLSPAEVDFFRKDFEEQPLDPNLSYRIARTSAAANARLRDLAAPMLSGIRSTTNLQVDLADGGIYFDTGPRHRVNFNWHQDAESFFRFQNHYDYLNFYIPIVKPRKDKSNLRVVPFDVLKRQDPKAYQSLMGGGAAAMVRVGRFAVWVCDDSGQVRVMREEIEDMATTPMLDVGDLLLMRGDTVHRTQDAETERVALSYRVTSSAARLSRKRLVAGGPMKATLMANNAPVYERMFAVFDRAGRKDLRVDEMQKALAQLPPIDTRTRDRFMRHLLLEKLKAGSLWRFALSASISKALTYSARATARYHQWAARARRPRPAVG